MNDIKIPQVKYFNLSAFEVLRGMVRLYGLQEVWSALSEIAAEPLLAVDPPLAGGTRTDSKNMFVSPESRTDGTAGN